MCGINLPSATAYFSKIEPLTSCHLLNLFRQLAMLSHWPCCQMSTLFKSRLSGGLLNAVSIVPNQVMFACGGAFLFMSFCFACWEVYGVCMCAVESERAAICRNRSISSSSSSLLCYFFVFFSYFSCPLPSFSSPLLLLFHLFCSPLLSSPCLTTFWLPGAVDKHFCWICHSHLASICVFFFSLFFLHSLSWWGDWQRRQALASPHAGKETLTGASSQPWWRWMCCECWATTRFFMEAQSSRSFVLGEQCRETSLRKGLSLLHGSAQKAHAQTAALSV